MIAKISSCSQKCIHFVNKKKATGKHNYYKHSKQLPYA